MILPLSTASHLYWLGRYMIRAGQLIQVLPFKTDRDAQQFALSFGISGDATAAELNIRLMDSSVPNSLPVYLGLIAENIQATRGVLSAASFEAFYALDGLKNQLSDASQKLLVCQTILKHEAGLVKQFYQLGVCIEQLDIDLRLKSEAPATIAMLSDVVTGLPTNWEQLLPLMTQLANAQPTLQAMAPFNALCDQVHFLFRDQ